MRRRKVGNLLALAVLSYLSQRPMHPYELSRTLRDHGDDRSIRFTHGTLYMVVEQLARAGFVVAKESVRDTGRPERTVYAITEAGRRELTDWLRELVEEPQHEYPPFVAALSLIGALRPAEAVRLLRHRLDRLADRKADIQHHIDQPSAAGVHPLFLIEEDFRLALVDAEVAFCRRLIDRITDPETGWSFAWDHVHDHTAPAQPADADPHSKEH